MATCSKCGKSDLIWLQGKTGKFYLAENRGKVSTKINPDGMPYGFKPIYRPHFLFCESWQRLNRQ